MDSTATPGGDSAGSGLVEELQAQALRSTRNADNATASGMLALAEDDKSRAVAFADAAKIAARHVASWQTERAALVEALRKLVDEFKRNGTLKTTGQLTYQPFHGRMAYLDAAERLAALLPVEPQTRAGAAGEEGEERG